MVISSAYSYANELSKTQKNSNLNPILATLLAFSSYFVTIPNNINFAQPKEKVIEGFATSFFSYEGMFTALIVSFIAITLYAHLSKSRFTIKLPGTVPPNVFESFVALIPMSVVLIIFGIIRIILEVCGFHSLIEMITKFVMQPLASVGTGLPAILIVILAEQLLWFFGLHGFNIVWGLVSALWLPLFLKNVSLYASTHRFSGIEIAPNTMTNVYAMIGGSGATFGLLLAMFIFCRKGSAERELAKLSFIPGCFGINEPIIFGFPIVLNPIMFIPWILVPMINAIIAYFATKSGWVVPLVVLNSGNEPIFLSQFILGAFHWSPVILSMILVVLDVLLYAPFVIINQRALAKQTLQS